MGQKIGNGTIERDCITLVNIFCQSFFHRGASEEYRLVIPIILKLLIIFLSFNCITFSRGTLVIYPRKILIEARVELVLNKGQNSSGVALGGCVGPTHPLEQ